MAKKRFIKIPKRIDVKCYDCDYINRLEVPENDTIHQFECKNCKKIIRAPVTQCCIICAFTDKKCSLNSKIEARAKGLMLR
jgi:hypothetical protein